MKEITQIDIEKLQRIANNHIVVDHNDNPFVTQKGIMKILEALHGFNAKCEHDFKKVSDKRYPFRPVRCVKCGMEP